MKKWMGWTVGMGAAALMAAPLNPDIVKKEVKTVRRPAMVSVIGSSLMQLPPDGKTDVDAMIEFWTTRMDREVVMKPDMIVLPEICDMWAGLKTAGEKHNWIEKRGDKILNAFREYAKKHKTYIIYPAYRQLGNKRYQNSAFVIDREGDVVGRYDKLRPTVRDIAFGAVPGKAPVAVDTDFGRIAMLICFDLNFWELLDSYIALKPDILLFSSYYHGDFMLKVWAYKCRAHLVASTIGSLPKEVVSPCGTTLRLEEDYEWTLSEMINTNCKVVHLDFNQAGIQAARAKYGRKIKVDTAGSVGAVTMYSEDPALPIENVLKEFNIELWDDYYKRSVDACNEAIKTAPEAAWK